MAKAKKRVTKKVAKKSVVAKVSAPKLLARIPKLPGMPKFDRRKVMIGVGVVAIAIILYFFKGLFVAAWVNGRPITRIAMIQELERQDGGTVLNSLVTKELIMQEAKKNNVSISQNDVDAEITKVEDQIKAQGQTLDDALATQGWTRADLEDQIKIQLIVEKLLADKINVSDQEIDDYIKTNKSTDTRENVAALLKQQKLMTEYQTWISGLLAQAKVNYWVKY